MIAPVAVGMICGFGPLGYTLALQALAATALTGQTKERLVNMSTKKTGVDQQLIRDLAGILNDTNLTEIEVELGDLKVRVSRQAPAVHAVAAPRRPIAAGRRRSRRRLRRRAAADMSKNAVPSPMVGTAYLSPVARRQAVHRGRPDGARKARRC